MSQARIKDFYDQMVKAGLYKAGEVDLSRSRRCSSSTRSVGMDVKAKLGGKLITSSRAGRGADNEAR